MKPLLLFHLDLGQSNSLIEGRLILIDKEKDELVEMYIATSGLPGYQSFDDLSKKGRGAIPPQYQTKINNYTLTTKPIYLPDKVGVEGNFYKIDPYTVEIDSIERGDFGIHADRNMPGSSGCIVLRTEIGWQAFQERMKEMGSLGISQIPLLISYVR